MRLEEFWQLNYFTIITLVQRYCYVLPNYPIGTSKVAVLFTDNIHIVSYIIINNLRTNHYTTKVHKFINFLFFHCLSITYTVCESVKHNTWCSVYITFYMGTFATVVLFQIQLALSLGYSTLSVRIILKHVSWPIGQKAQQWNNKHEPGVIINKHF